MKNILVISTVSLLMMLSICLDVAAQSSVSTLGRRMDEINKLGDKAAKDALDRDMKSGRKPSKEELRRAAQVRAEIKEDLENLQAIYNDLVTKLASRDTLSADQVRETAVKIHKHAERLKTNIPFPKDEQVDPAAAVDKHDLDLRRQVRNVCVSLFDFLTNPTIENTGLIDADKSRGARDALDRIIEGAGRLTQRTRDTSDQITNL